VQRDDFLGKRDDPEREQRKVGDRLIRHQALSL
jgi:hypothetical protein